MNFLTKVLLILASLLLSSVLFNLLYNTLQLTNKKLFFLIQLLPFLVALVVLLKIQKIEFKTAFKGLKIKLFLLVFSFWMLFFIAGMMLNTNSLKYNFQGMSFFYLLLISLIFIAIQTYFEELFFRKFIQDVLISYFKVPLLGISISSVFFAVLHFNNPEVKLLHYLPLVYIFLVGISLGIIVYFLNSVFISWAFHYANNLFSAIILTNNWQVFQTDALFIDFSKPTIDFFTWFLVLILLPIFVVFLSRIYKWKFNQLISKSNA